MKNRYEFGMEMLKKVDGHAGEAVVAPLGDLGNIHVEWFGDIYGREGLTLREREIATITTAINGMNLLNSMTLPGEGK